MSQHRLKQRGLQVHYITWYLKRVLKQLSDVKRGINYQVWHPGRHSWYTSGILAGRFDSSQSSAPFVADRMSRWHSIGEQWTSFVECDIIEIAWMLGWWNSYQNLLNVIFCLNCHVFESRVGWQHYKRAGNPRAAAVPAGACYCPPHRSRSVFMV